MKTIQLLILSVLCAASAQASNFSVKDYQYEQKTYLTVTAAVSNSLADEKLMGEIIKQAQAELIYKLFELNASNSIPEKLLNSELIKKFDLREEELKKITSTLNQQVKQTRKRQQGDGPEWGDAIPDAVYLYYPLLRGNGKFAFLGQVAAVATWVSEKTYEVPQSQECTNVSVENIKKSMATGTTEVAGCQLVLVDETSRPDVAVYAMVGADRNFFAHVAGPARRRAGIGLIWDMKNQLASANDVAGMGASASLGPIVKPIQMGLGALWRKLSKGANRGVVVPKGEVGLESVSFNIPTQFNVAALSLAFKDVNNYRFGGIYTGLKDIGIMPDYVTVSFDLNTQALKDVFGLNVEEPSANAAKEEGGSALKATAFAFVPLDSLVNYGIELLGLDKLEESYNSAEKVVKGND